MMMPLINYLKMSIKDRVRSAVAESSERNTQMLSAALSSAGDVWVLIATWRSLVRLVPYKKYLMVIQRW